MTRTFKFALLLAALLPQLAVAGWLYWFKDGEAMSRTNLMANLNHMHNVMVGGNHGARLLDSDVAPNAKLQFSKFATPTLFPKAWVATDTCPTTTSNELCTIESSVGVRWVRSDTAADGIYNICWDAPTSDIAFGATTYNRTAVLMQSGDVTVSCALYGTTNAAAAVTDCPDGQLSNVLCMNMTTSAYADSSIQAVMFSEVMP